MSPDVERRLLDASMAVLDAHGAGGLTVEKICEAAGVPRSTFYRRWPSAADAVAAAVKEVVADVIPHAPDTGDVREDLVQMSLGTSRLLQEGRFGRMLSFLMAEIEQKPDFRKQALELSRHRRRHIAEVVERGHRGSRISETIDAAMFVEVLSGALIFRHFFGETPPDRAYAERLVDLLVRPATDES